MALTRATDKIIANADGNLNLSGIVTAANFVGGGAGLTGLNVDASALKSGSDIKAQANPHGVVVTGVLTATSYSGDGSNLTNLPAGLGTALSSDQTNPLNKLYYTNEILSIGSTVTVDHPVTGTGAYTQYADIRLEEDADLIIEDGDDVIPDILGLGTDGGGLGAGGSGRIRVDSITNKNANGAPNFTNGLTATTGTFTGNLNVGGVLTYEDVTNIDSVGIITARAGINLVGNDLNVGSNIKIGNASGIATVSALKITNGTTSVNKHSVGVGTTTTAGRNAGVSTAIGTINFNSTLDKLEFYNGSKWLQITDNRFKVSGGTQSTFGNYTLFTFTSNGTFTVTGSDSIDILVVGGGGQGGMPNASSNYGGGGGAGGLVWYTGFNVAEGEYSIVVGDGAPTDTSGSGNRRGLDGSDSTAFGLTAKGGGGGGGQGGTPTGRPGGSGGGGGYNTGGAAGGAAQQPSQSNSLASGTLVHNLGNAGGAGNDNPNGGGGGGGAGGAGFSGTGTGNPVHGGAGYDMSSHLGTAVGDNGWFSGGGGGIQVYANLSQPYGNGGQGLYGGGGRGARYNTNTQTTGTANTGGGGGGGSNLLGGRGGGSGVVIIRILTSLLP